MSLKYLGPLFIYLAIGLSNGQAKRSTFFEHSNWEGQSYTVEFEGLACFNMPSWFNDKASSVNTDNNCILAFEHGECEGKMERIAPGTRDHANLGGIDMNDKISSFRQCPPNENTCRGVNVDVDYSEAPDMKDVAMNMKRVIQDWYPFTCRLLYSPSLREVGTIQLKIDGKNEGVAGAGGNLIVAHASHFRPNPNDLGAMVHEMAHIIQHYRKCDGWLTEGIADYPRRWWYEQEKPRKPSGNFEGSAHTYFLRWIDEHWPNTIYKLNHECREGTYDTGLLQRLTGKNAEQLWDQMKRE